MKWVVKLRLPAAYISRRLFDTGRAYDMPAYDLCSQVSKHCQSERYCPLYRLLCCTPERLVVYESWCVWTVREQRPGLHVRTTSKKRTKPTRGTRINQKLLLQQNYAFCFLLSSVEPTQVVISADILNKCDERGAPQRRNCFPLPVLIFNLYYRIKPVFKAHRLHGGGCTSEGKTLSITVARVYPVVLSSHRDDRENHLSSPCTSIKPHIINNKLV